MEQVHQRLVAAYDLEALKENETKQYIKHRLDQVGWKGDPAISEAVYPVIYKFSHGIPRRINLFCSRLFLHGSVEEKHKLAVVDAKIVIHELQLENLASLKMLSDIDFDTPDKYEVADLESIEPPIAAEPAPPSMQQPSHSPHSEQLSAQARIEEKEILHKQAVNRKSAVSKQQKNTKNNEQVLKQPVSRQQVKSNRHDQPADKKSSAGKQVNRPDDADENNSQKIANDLDAEIDALDIDLDGLSDNVDVLLHKNKEPGQSTDKVEITAKPRNKFVTLVLFVTVSLMLLTALLFATTSKTLDGKINAAGNWLDGISERVQILLNSNTEVEEKTINVDTKPVALTPDNLTVSTSNIEREVLQLAKEDQLEQRKSVEENLSNKRAVENTDERTNALSAVGNSLEEKEIHSAVEVEQSNKSMEKNNDVNPVKALMPTDIIATTSKQKDEKDESLVEPDKIDEQSADVSVIQKDDQYTSDNMAVKEQVMEENWLVKKLFFKFDSVDIQADDLIELRDIAGQLDASPESSALIIGYSDNVGDEKYNLNLSMKRARAVASYLASQDISTDRLRTDGRGVHPVEKKSESNSEETVSDFSRMVEIYLIPPVNQE